MQFYLSSRIYTYFIGFWNISVCIFCTQNLTNCHITFNSNQPITLRHLLKACSATPP